MDIENKYGMLSRQQSLLELGKCFHDICLKNGVKYSLAYGSLLGAVRHHGFIPWDDDIDVFLDRENYSKLIAALAQESVLKVEQDIPATLWIDRVRFCGSGATMDLFVLDAVPEGAFTRKMKYVLIILLQGMMKKKYSLSKGSFFVKCGSVLAFYFGKLFSTKRKAAWYRKVSQIGNRKGGSALANYNGEYAYLKKQYPRDMMNHLTLCPFEDTSLYIVEGFDNCLKTVYGDYMTPPEESERKPKHSSSVGVN